MRVTDLLMPGIDGTKVHQRTRSQEEIAKQIATEKAFSALREKVVTGQASWYELS